ncbi:MAG TPA: HAD-IB family phosphatase [Gemmatimonadaceae bacterium]|jgi:Haloacid Dehalogenase superfamily, subfamily IB, phosphoserine phosphatase-like
MSAYASVVLDMDSTVSSLEGIDWLAKQCNEEVARQVAALTRRAMGGELGLHEVYGERLALIRPSTASIAALARLYEQRVAPGAPAAIERMRAAGVNLVIVSGGILQAIVPCARTLGFADTDVHAVRMYFNEHGEYDGYDASSPLTTHDGKEDVVRALSLARPILAVGDGATDSAMAAAADSFAAYTEFVRREQVVAAADRVLRSFDDLLELVLP